MTARYSNTTKYYILGFFLVSLLGTLAHFVYDWSGQNAVTGLFFPINESTWEHMKLLFFPMLIWGGFFYPVLQKKNPCFPYLLLCSTCAGTCLIPVLFYTYRGILGSSFSVLDISIFYISVLFSFILLYLRQTSCHGRWGKIVLVVLTTAFFIGFLVFTYATPKLGIFEIPNASPSNSH